MMIMANMLSQKAKSLLEVFTFFNILIHQMNVFEYLYVLDMDCMDCAMCWQYINEPKRWSSFAILEVML